MAELVRKNRDQDKDFYFASLKIVAKKALTKIMSREDFEEYQENLQITAYLGKY